MFTSVFLAASTRADGDKSEFAAQITGFFEDLIHRIPSWIAGFVLFIATIFIAKIAKSAVESRIADQVDEEHQGVMVLAGRVTYFGTLVLGITIALKVAGIDLTTILAAVAFGIGFALRDFIMNFLAGVMILVSRQFTIGDFIKVGKTIGKVMEIQTRATILKAFDGTKVIVPNAEIFTNPVTSYTTNPIRRVAVPLYISYEMDIGYAMKIAIEAMKKHPKILKRPPPTVIVKEFGGSAIIVMARFWVGSRDGWYKVRSEILHKFSDELDKAGIIIPYSVLHLETEQDTAESRKQMEDVRKKKQEEMELSKAILEDSEKTKTDGIVTTALPISGNGQIKNPLVPATAEVTIPITPPGEFLDLEEIDAEG